MGLVPLALSVHKFISSVGADAGFAALIAVAILVLLYFAHARETSGLRAHIAELLERVSELETALARVAANQARVAPAPVVRAPAPALRKAPAAAVPAAASAASRLAALELPPGPPAGVGAPALSSATRVIPASVAARIGAARVAVAAGVATAVGAATAVGVGAGGAPPDAVPVQAGSGEPPRTPAEELAGTPTALAPATPAGGQLPAPAQAGGNGASAHAPAQPAGAREAPGAPAPVRALGGSPPRQPAGRQAGGSAATSRRAAGRPSSVPVERTPPRRSSGSRVPRSLLVGLAVLIVAAIVVAAVVLSQSGGSGSHASNTTGANASAGAARHRARATTAVRVIPANVTVAILNGTTVNDLAHKVAAKLVPPYREGTVGDAPDQTHTTTIVAYLPGHRAAAVAVARSLGLATTAVHPIDPSTQNVACSGAAACTTDVVVTVGSDLASL